MPSGSFKQIVNRRPQNLKTVTAPFYLYIKIKRKPDDNVRMGEDKINMMKTIVADTILESNSTFFVVCLLYEAMLELP